MEKNTTYNITTSKEYAVEEFIEYWQSIIPKDKQKLSPTDFWQIQRNDVGPKNIDVVYKAYDKLDQEKYKDDYSGGNLEKIPAGVTLAFPILDTTILLQEVVNKKQFLNQGSFKAYWSENYAKLIGDPDFAKDNVIDYNSDSESLFVRYQSLNIRVWIYIKALDKVIDISPYIINCTTVKAFQGSAFNITVAPFYDSKIKRSSGNYFDIVNTTTGKGYGIKSFLEKFLQTNDIVFIRFERLALEKGKEDVTEESLEIPKNKLANSGSNINVWDMIGIVDVCQESFSSEDNFKATTISGRDIEKVFVEDGSYFLPLKEIQGAEDHWWYEGAESESWFKRNIVSGDFQYLWSYGFKKIDEMIFFIINIMSNLGLVQSNVFDSWDGVRTSSYEVTGAPTLEVKGIWQIVKVFVEDSVKKRVLVDSSIGNPNGTLMDYMNRVCQYPFVEFYFDTYINTIDLIVRQPPFTEAAIMGVVNSQQYVVIKAQDVLSCSLSYDSRVYSWYQIHMKNSISGSNEFVNLSLVPIVFLNTYAEIWGNRKLEVTDIYLNYEEKKSIDEVDKLATMQAAALNDLLYLVETNAYLPFTRTGTIEVSGDRRVKVGTFILNEYSNELFYVTGVTNTVSFSEGGIDRRTVIRVERGMYYPILKGNWGETVKRLDNARISQGTANYFKIVKLDKIKEAIQEASSGKTTTLQCPTIDKSQFDYFLNRKMFSE